MEDVSTLALFRDSRDGSLVERVGIQDVEISRMKMIVVAVKALLNG
jgi:hypothetical protein